MLLLPVFYDNILDSLEKDFEFANLGCTLARLAQLL